jgi:hypothetical protein
MLVNWLKSTKNENGRAMKPKLEMVSFAEIERRNASVAWVSVSYCAGGEWFINSHGPKPITRYVYATREEAYKSKAQIDQFGCGGGCENWHAVERALPKERIRKEYDVERKNYARYGGTIPRIYLLPADRQHQKPTQERREQTSSKAPQAGIVYILHAEGTERIKIGRSIYATPRIEALQTASPFPLTVLRKIPTQDIAQLERALHKRYAPYRQYREWFTLPVPLLMALLEEQFD